MTDPVFGGVSGLFSDAEIERCRANALIGFAGLDY